MTKTKNKYLLFSEEYEEPTLYSTKEETIKAIKEHIQTEGDDWDKSQHKIYYSESGFEEMEIILSPTLKKK